MASVPALDCRTAPDKEFLAELEAKHGEVHVLDGGGYHVVVRKPRRADYQKYRDKQASPATRSSAMEGLFMDTCVHPHRDLVKDMLNDLPALGDLFGAEVLDLCGIALESNSKKYQRD